MKNNYQRKSLKVKSIQWFKGDDCLRVKRYFHASSIIHPRCHKCNKPISKHGHVETVGGDKMVCPGMWIVVDEYGDCYCWTDDIFRKNYEVIDDE
jgi:hypothetical protein